MAKSKRASGNKGVDLHIFLNEDMVDEMRAKAEEGDRTLTQEIRRAVRYYLENVAVYRPGHEED